MTGARPADGEASIRQRWATQNLEQARADAAFAVGSATGSANQLHEAITRDPALTTRLAPLAERMYAAAAAARLVESDVATALAEHRRSTGDGRTRQAH